MRKRLFILDTLDGVRAVNSSRVMRQRVSDASWRLARDIISKLSDDDSLKDMKCGIYGAYAFKFRYEIFECGKENLDFPNSPFNDRFFDWLMSDASMPKGVKLSLSPRQKYIILPAFFHVGDMIIYSGWQWKPIYEALSEIKVAKSSRLTQKQKDIISTYQSSGYIPDPNESNALQEIAKLIKVYDTRLIKDMITNIKERDNITLEGLWGGADGLLKQYTAFELANKAITSKELEGYLGKSGEHELLTEARKRLADKDKRRKEISEKDLPMVRDEDGEEVSPMALIPDTGASEATVSIFELPGLTEMELKICHLLDKKSKPKKKEMAKQLNISRPTLNSHLRKLRMRVKQALPSELGVPQYKEDGTFPFDGTRGIPDKTAFGVERRMTREEFLKLLE